MNILKIIFFYRYITFILVNRIGYVHCTMAYQQNVKGKQINEYTHIQTNTNKQAYE